MIRIRFYLTFIMMSLFGIAFGFFLVHEYTYASYSALAALFLSSTLSVLRKL